MAQQNLQELLDEGKIDINSLYVVYEANSDIPLYMNGDGWYENIYHNKMVVRENFNKLYVVPNVRIEAEEEQEPTINFTLAKINRVGLWEKFCIWKGWDYYMSAERISNWEENVEIPISKAKQWGLI